MSKHRRLPSSATNTATTHPSAPTNTGADTQSDIERLWADEIKRRVDALEAGRTHGEEWSQVRSRLKRGERA